MSPKPSLVFDLDGTLIDVKKRHWTVYKIIIESLGGNPLPIDSYWRKKRQHIPVDRILSFSFPGKSTHRVCADANSAHTVWKPSLPDYFRKQFETMIEQPKFLSIDTCFSFTHQILKTLQPLFHLNLVTVRRNEKTLLQQLDNLQLTQYFERIVTKKPGDDPAQTKISLIKSNNIAPIAIIGDTQADIGAACGLSVPSIAVTNGMRTKQFLIKHNPTYIAPTIQQVSKYIEKIMQGYLVLTEDTARRRLLN
jgi:phosphoglycolate phosphatase